MTISAPKSAGEWLILFIRLIIGAVFVYASVNKIFNPEGFARIIHNYRLVGPAYINILAIILPWLEFIMGACLILGIKYRAANAVILAMLTVFTIAMAINYVRGVNINCGCFSTSESVKSNLLVRVVEDLLLMAGCILIMLKNKLLRRATGFSPAF